MDQKDIPQKEHKVDAQDAEKNKGMAVIAYIVFFIPLLTDAKDSPFAKFHVKQGLILLLFCIAGSIISSVLTVVLIGLLLGPIVALATLVLFIIGIMNAVNGKMKELPYIGQFAEKWFTF